MDGYVLIDSDLLSTILAPDNGLPVSGSSRLASFSIRYARAMQGRRSIEYFYRQVGPGDSSIGTSIGRLVWDVSAFNSIV